ncbi:TPA: deoxyribonuclease IV [Clostridioides difficile]|uniref:Probable endonuclease 4 n=2 Tax=Clostridioides difficile TaxID=1496 RepID=A0A069A2X4_CLODI|nr:deoxyribonuclease IV [Clostridioides difficile]EQG63312.1 apurinic endonuclease family protein [Clostridioides difficile DA00149]EQI48518.1 apurinic endonuclease family protein [Clostridioides difficile Y184]EQK93493.1 apurinic endonuclease family protein [Clostridioides difficile CD127]OFU15488.1 endonuclease IV [Clostridium sp. HMSC19C11]AMM55955.1 endonuclease IV [Clostridioides difficile]
MIKLGTHLSIAKGFANAAETAVYIGANTFQFFSRNPRGGNAKEFDEKDIIKFQEIRKENNFAPLLAHAPYTMNLGGTKDDVYEFATRVIDEDIRRMDSLGIEYMCFHPGSHVGGGVDFGIDRIVKGLNNAIKGDENITILLETMSGKGTEIGFKFEQLKSIIDKIEHKEKIGVCLDTCHIFSAGYDIVNDLDGVLEEFDKVIGIERLKTVHLNDSMMPFGDKKDRHAPIGEGKIGLKALIDFMEHPSLKHLPFFLETPFDDEGHKKELKMIKEILSSK